MPGDGISEGPLSRVELGELAELFDQFHFAFDPTDHAAKQAETEFYRRLADLFATRIRMNHPEVTFDAFVSRVRVWCWEFLKKNKP
jgi:hypothetical protein